MDDYLELLEYLRADKGQSPFSRKPSPEHQGLQEGRFPNYQIPQFDLLDPLPDAAFALHVMPNAQHGVVGLLLCCIFLAAMGVVGDLVVAPAVAASHS